MTTDYRKFIETWHQARWLEDVVESLGLDRRRCSNIAASLRRQGVPLPKRESRAWRGVDQEGRHAPVDWDGLRRWSLACKAATDMAKLRKLLAT